MSDRHGWNSWEQYYDTHRTCMQAFADHFIRHNAHPHLGHPTPHHVHRYDVNGIEIALNHVGEEGWPTLYEVFIELHQLWTEGNLPG